MPRTSRSTAPDQLALQFTHIHATRERLRLDQLPPNDSLGVAISDDFLQNILSAGVLKAIDVAPRSDAGYSVLDGKRRIIGARARGDHEIACDVWPEGMTRNALLTLVLHHRSRNLHAESHAVRSLLAAGLSETEVADASGVSVAAVRAMHRVTNLVPPLQTALVTGAIAPTAAVAAARLDRAEQSELARVYAETCRLTVRDVAAARRAARDRRGGAEEPSLPGLGADIAWKWRVRAQAVALLREAPPLAPPTMLAHLHALLSDERELPELCSVCQRITENSQRTSEQHPDPHPRQADLEVA